MANIKDAKIWLNLPNVSQIKIFFSYTLFFLHFFVWLLLIACFGIVAEF